VDDKPPSAKEALQAAARVLDDISKEFGLSADGEKARAMVKGALANVPEKIQKHSPEQRLRPAGRMAPMADQVDRKVKEQQESRQAKGFEKYLKKKPEKDQDRER
jgi:hypothetical protein